MTTQVLHLRSAVNKLRPRPTDLLDGQLMLNTNADEAGVYFRLSDNSLARIGGIHVGTTPPNSAPAGQPGNSEGEAWVDTTDPQKPLFKVYQNGAWFTVSTEGLNGANGAKGEEGLSAYGSAVKGGFSGTEPQWVASLKGEPGASGGSGSDGSAATITVGTTTTLGEGESATVSNSGTSSAAVFDFGIPQGQKGQKGEVMPHPDGVTIDVYNGETGTITKGKAVYVSGTHSSGLPLVKLADNDDLNTYPAVGLVQTDIAFGAVGEVLISGALEGIDTDASGWDPGTSLYIDSTAGDLVATRPTGANEKVQKVAMVTRRDAVDGSLIVIGAGRTNDVPNELTTLTGVGLNDTDLGTFSGTTITDSSSIKTALQELETQVETNIGAAALRTALNILSYADDTAAQSGGLTNGDIYWNTTDGKLRAV